VLDDGALAWADFSGNRQYVSIGNVAAGDRASLFFMDYPNRLRLKVLGHMSVFEAGERPDLASALNVGSYRATVEHHIRVNVEAFDWNCSQHITPRFSLPEIEMLTAPLRANIEELERQLAAAAAV
jgi:predicted pyridoxine 5'-phosphate oxidase superfamily flavin-nucleotide-binding protein